MYRVKESQRQYPKDFKHSQILSLVSARQVADLRAKATAHHHMQYIVEAKERGRWREVYRTTLATE